MGAEQNSLFDTAPVQPPAGQERTLREARAQVMAALPEGGIHCPCCDQFARVYVRKLAATAVVVLLRLLARRGGEWTHMPDFLRDEGFSASYYPDVIRAKWWGLIQEHVGQGGAGVYRLTPDGVAFLQGHTTVAAKVATYNDELWGTQPEGQVDVRGALGKRFSYAELMSDRPAAAATQGA